MKELITNWFKILQDDICTSLEKLEPTSKFKEDNWSYKDGGGGRSRIIEGKIFDKGGVNLSAVHGPVPDSLKQNFELNNETFFATGVSIVIHPKNPFVPIIHMNVRYFESGKNWWFGGGIDLTPVYINDDESRFFHKKLKEICDKHSPEYYQKFKLWADQYFFIPHRNESRGIGGIFFDRLFEGATKNDLWKFVQD
ncbi:MAG: coproporphyrinogen III oxidase, partial [Nitrosopumilus sp.]|nr:coproporphyrinogen III oxidase [Nitrosopumilus sp.]